MRVMMSMLSQIRARMTYRQKVTLWLLAWIFPAACMAAALLAKGPLGSASPVELVGQALGVVFFVKASSKLELLAV